MIKKAHTSATAMADIGKAAAQARLEASTQADEPVVYKTTAPIVIAFEVMLVKNAKSSAPLRVQRASARGHCPDGFPVT
jgi:hypothetical protein